MTKKEEEMISMIDDFKLRFYKKFDILPLVDYEDKKTIPLTPMFLIKEAANKLANELGFKSIEMRRRKRELVLIRYVAFSYASEQRYTLTSIGKFMAGENKPFDHATVLHGKLSLKNLLETKNILAIELVERFKRTLVQIQTEKYGKENEDGNDGSVQLDPSETSNT